MRRNLNYRLEIYLMAYFSTILTMIKHSNFSINAA